MSILQCKLTSYQKPSYKLLSCRLKRLFSFFCNNKVILLAGSRIWENSVPRLWNSLIYPRFVSYERLTGKLDMILWSSLGFLISMLLASGRYLRSLISALVISLQIITSHFLSWIMTWFTLDMCSQESDMVNLPASASLFLQNKRPQLNASFPDQFAASAWIVVC